MSLNCGKKLPLPLWVLPLGPIMVPAINDLRGTDVFLPSPRLKRQLMVMSFVFSLTINGQAPSTANHNKHALV